MKYSILLAIFLLPFICLGQGIPNDPSYEIGPSSYNVQITPNNPEMDQFERFGNTPTNSYNGTANITVPIYNVNFEGINIPIQAQYNTGGIRVAQEASWIGLGWSLNEGYSISREVQGFDDLNSSEYDHKNIGWIYSPTYLKQDPNAPFGTIRIPPSDFAALSQSYSANQPHDTEPDLFTINLPHTSVHFYLPKIEGTETTLIATVQNEKNFTVIYDIVAKTFEVKDPAGFTFSFESKEFSTGYSSWDASPSNTDEIQALQGIPSWSTRQSRMIIMDWKLDKITSPGGRELSFNFIDGLHYTFPTYSERSDLGIPDGAYVPKSIGNTFLSNLSASVTIFHNKYLHSITGDFGSIEFVKSTRQDLSSNETVEDLANRTWNPSVSPNQYNAKKLDQVLVKDLHGSIITQADFTYSYFNTDELNNPSIDVKEQYIRLKLDEIQVNDQKHSFTYIQPNDLPKKDSKAVDFWGFYNGINNTLRIPTSNRFYQRNALASSWPHHALYVKRNGANRKSDVHFGKIGTLSEVTYPSGGKTKFEYEGNSVTLQRVNYSPQYRDNSSIIEYPGLSNSEDYNFRYQYLKLANDPNYELFDYNGCVTSIDSFYSGDSFQVTDTEFCTGQDQNVKIDATLSCVTGCGNVYPTGPAVWIEDANGNMVQLLFVYDNQFNINTSQVYLEAELNLNPGNYVLKVQQWTNADPFAVATASASGLVWEDESAVEMVYEEFEVGGTRINKVINTDEMDEFLTGSSYEYEEIINGNSSSSGKLMDDLVYTSSGYSNYEYTPEFFDDSCPGCGGHKAYLHSDNMIRISNAAAGSHVGYNQVTTKIIDKYNNNIGWNTTSYINQANDYLTRFVGQAGILVSSSGSGAPSPNTTAYYQMIYDETYGNYYNIVPVYYGDTYIIGGISNTYSYKNGSVLEENLYDKTGTLISKTENTYQEYTPTSGPFGFYPKILYFDGVSSVFHPYEHVWNYRLNGSHFIRPLSTINTEFEGTISFSKTTSFEYENPEHYMPTKTISNTSDVTRNLIKKAYYPQDLDLQNQDATDLMADHKFNIPMLYETYLEESGTEKLLTTKKIDFNSFNGNILPNVIKSMRGEASGSNSLEDRMIYHDYDINGNLIDASKKLGHRTSYIYGYNDMYPIAILENRVYSSISTATINTLKSLSNSDNDDCLSGQGCSEDALRAALNNLRTQFPNSMVTTYTYNPLVGITSMTDPKGYTVYYTYDANNRLAYIKDQDGNLLNQYEYNYKVN